MLFRVTVGLLVVTMLACEPEVSENSPFEEGRVLGVNENRKLKEASGLAESRRHPGYLWSHNDSGHPADLYLLDTTGQTVATWRIAGARNRDWEDMAIGPGPNGKPMLLVGDIGDNREKYPTKTIYFIEEPDFAFQGDIPVADTIVLRLGDEMRNMETMMIDPLTRNIYLVTKMEKNIRVYEITYPYAAGIIEVSPILRLPFRFITAGDISSDGGEILMKSYSAIYYWTRLPGQSVIEALQMPPTELSYAREPQGEAIAWAADGSGFYTLSENGKGERGRLIFYKRKAPADSTAAEK